MNALITIVILAAVALFCARAEHKRFERQAARDAEQFRRDFYVGLAEGARGHLEDLIEATREGCDCHFDPAPGNDPPCVFVPCEQHKREQADWDAWENDMKTGSGL